MTIQDIKPAGSGGGGERGAGAGSRRSGGARRLAVGAAVLLAAAGVALLMALGRGGALRGEEGVRTVRVPAPPPLTATADTLGSGQTLANLLSGQGFAPREIHRLVEVVREFESPQDLQPGARLEVRRKPLVGEVRELALRLDADRTLELRRRDSAWAATLDSVPVTTDTITVAGLVTGNTLFGDGVAFSGDTAELAPDEDVEIVSEVTNIFEWRIDFFRELRTGDAFRVAIRRHVRPDGTIRSARVLAAEFRNGSRHLWAIHFDSPDPTVDGYYDLDGESLRTQFLRAPLDYRRVTSGFSRSRYHPVLERRRAHLGIDYGAGRGTTIRATGDGVVTKRRWWGGYGRMVEIRHNARYRTRYAHMSGWARGLDVGDRVAQGDPVGYVGSSGTATGPHVHYEFLEYGEQVDPADLELPPGDPVPEGQMDRFVRQREPAVAELVQHRLPRPPRLAGPEGADDRATP